MKLIKYLSITGLAALAASTWFTVPLHATVLDVSTPRYAVPPNIVTNSNRPMLMLAASKDHTLFGPIYTDFEDLDASDELGFGELDTGFKPTFKYYGYFDPSKCYAYSTSDGRFNPAANAILVDTTVTGLLNGVSTTQTKKRYTCSSSQSYWSGNFLNWASMTRLDVVRKMLYGGKRSTDTSTLTVLERTGLNFDAHSFTKFYGGTDIRDYTPFTTTALTKSTGPNANIYAGLTICQTGTEETRTGGTPVMKMVKGNYRFWNTVEITVCRYSDDSPTPNSNAKFSQKLARYYKGPNGTGATTAGLVYGGGAVFHEITLPSQATDGAKYGASNEIGPTLIMRVKACDASFIGEERCQAYPPTSTTNFKPYGLFQEFGYSFNSSASARAEFGVITGSYDRNVTAGALRKNMGDFADEINATTGVFCHSPSSGCAATLPSPDGRTTGAGAIKAFDSFALFGRTSSNSYGSATSSALTDGTLPAWGNPMGEMLVQALQYYSFNGSTPTPTNPSTTTNDTALGLPTVTWADPLSNANTDRKAKYGNAICRPLYAMALSSSALSFDNVDDTMFSTLANRSYGDGTVSAYTNFIGNREGIEGQIKSVGSVSGASTQGNSCSGKTIGTLSQVSGVCPDAPAMMGSYKVAGAALYANTSKIRTISPEPADLKFAQDALKVKTLTASLSGGAARIDILIPGSNPKKYVYITPESLWNNDIGSVLTFVSISSSPTHGAFMVSWNDALMGGDHDMDLTGFIRYDLVEDTSTTPSTWDVIITTDAPNNCSGKGGTHGFSIIGATKTVGGVSKDGNGRYLTHQHYSPGSDSNGTSIASVANKEGYYLCGGQTGDYSTFPSLTNAGSTSHLGIFNWQYSSLTDLTGSIDNTVTNAGGACRIHQGGFCNVQNKDFQIRMRFKMTGAENAVLRDPLWYAAKYGSMTSSTKNDDGSYSNLSVASLPTGVSAWDKMNEKGEAISDGNPDAYYLARRPDRLEEQLRQALDAIAKNSNAAPAVSSSQLISEGLKYVAKFDSTAVEGNVEAYSVDSLGFFETVPAWRAGNLLRVRTSGADGNGGDKGQSRQIITNFGNPSTATGSGAFPFRWASMPSGYQTLMTSSSTNRLSTTNASIVVDYMRGDQSKEAASTGLRVRGDNILGPIVNATPWIQDRPTANFSETDFPGYRAFVTANKSREKLLWVSAGDGMLHAFNPKKDSSPGVGGGSEVFAFVPGVLANRLAEIPLQRGGSGRTRLNGSNFTLDTSENLPTGQVWAYVDGSPFTGDVCLQCSDNSNRVWKTYAFTSLGRGGKALFALDTTDLTTLAAAETSTNPSSIFKWQFTSDDDADLGYIVNDISYSSTSGQANPIVKLNNGKFAVAVGNGNKSTNGKAALFLIYVDGPDASTGSWSGRYAKIVAEAGPSNGLSSISWIDEDGNGTADFMYAGDLKGNIWKFDVSSATPSNWGVAYKNGTTNLPLFTAKDGNNALPITTAPELVFPNFGGVIVAFGTGNAFEAADYPNTSRSQKFYGIWDRPDFAVANGRPLPTDLTTLVSRTYQRQSSGSVVITGTPLPIDWLTKDGWYFSLPESSEMVLSDPIMQASVLTFTTIRPRSGTDNCSDTPNVTLYTIDPISGKAEKNIQGTTTISSVTYLNAGKDIQDQKVRTVNDRTKLAFTTECRQGDPNCTCTTTNGVTTCKKTCSQGDPNCKCTVVGGVTTCEAQPMCAAGQSAKRVVGQNSNATLCYNSNARIQWREIPGLRTLE